MASDPNSPQVLANLRTPIEAQLLVNHLESVGIKAIASGAGPSTGWPEVPCESQVVVRNMDLERAKQVLVSVQQK